MPILLIFLTVNVTYLPNASDTFISISHLSNRHLLDKFEEWGLRLEMVSFAKRGTVDNSLSYPPMIKIALTSYATIALSVITT